MDDYLTKPIRADDLRRVLANVESCAQSEAPIGAAP